MTDRPNVKHDLMFFSVEDATEQLNHLWPDQRNYIPAHIGRLTSDMNENRFMLSNDAIVRIRGLLANGQNRLRAVVKSGKGQWFLVLDTDNADIFKIMDSGKLRSVGDRLVGTPYAKSLPAIARWVKTYESKSLAVSARGPGEAAALGNGGFFTTSVMVDYCKANESSLVEAAKFVSSLYDQTRLLKPSIAGALFVIASSLGLRDKVEAFLNEVYVGGAASVAQTLHARLIKNQKQLAKIPDGQIFGLTLKAFKAYRDGENPGTLKFIPSEAVPIL